MWRQTNVRFPHTCVAVPKFCCKVAVKAVPVLQLSLSFFFRLPKLAKQNETFTSPLLAASRQKGGAKVPRIQKNVQSFQRTANGIESVCRTP